MLAVTGISRLKGLNAADHALDAYKSTKAMDILNQTETGLYGLTAANGKDMEIIQTLKKRK
ncbi:hypothetical protein ACQKIC_01705 [Peribacillus sp. NPDC046944]|uniref:hypothetical protein n=1 Tax=unclassified Peribacillus TaxID=2675266 RepID=UPI003D006E05